MGDLQAAVDAMVEAVAALQGNDPRRVIRRDVDNFTAEIRITALERQALVDAAHDLRDALHDG